MAIDKLVNKALKQVDFKSRLIGNGSGSGGGSYFKSNVTCHRCVNKGHIKKDCISKGNSSIANQTNPKISFCNVLLIILLFHITDILKQPQ